MGLSTTKGVEELLRFDAEYESPVRTGNGPRMRRNELCHAIGKRLANVRAANQEP